MRIESLLSLVTSGEDKSWETNAEWFQNKRTSNINKNYEAVRKNKASRSLHGDYYRWRDKLANNELM